MTKEGEKVLFVRMPAELAARFEKCAKANGRTITQEAIKAIRHWLRREARRTKEGD